jgi:hypothetical protein
MLISSENQVYFHVLRKWTQILRVCLENRDIAENCKTQKSFNWTSDCFLSLFLSG